MEKKRSAGVMVFGVIIILISVASLIKSYEAFFELSSYSISVKIKFILFTVFSLLLGIIGIGLFLLKPWARIGVILGVLILSINKCISIVSTISYARKFSEFHWEPHISIGFFVPPIVYLSFIYFFTRPKVKEQFK